MTRRKKQVKDFRHAGRRAPVEVVVYQDAFKTTREVLDPDLKVLVVPGLLVYEDDEKIVLSQEMEHSEEYLKRDMDFYGIPKSQILWRKRYGTFDSAVEVKHGQNQSSAEARGTATGSEGSAQGDANTDAGRRRSRPRNSGHREDQGDPQAAQDVAGGN